ncbi:MAG TPA: LysR substrate-binding domain-containing protein [Kofleriaceae bacterium]|nr:LysR substrate-binding domain-containing protein [Kofleriaceae bacterium]
MDLNEIVVFAKVVDTRSFTAAAQQLGLPKSTVSRKIAQLEERLGVRLLQRTTRKLNLTEVGQAYYERCQRIVQDIAAAEQVVTDMQTAPRGLLRVTVPVDLGSTYMGALVADFLAQYPEIQLELDLADRIVDLIEEGVDLGIRFGPLIESTLIARKLGALQLRACAAPSYVSKRGAPTTPAQLADHDTLVFAPSGRAVPWMLHGPGGVVDATPRGRLVSNGVLALRDATRAGAGISLLPELVLADDVAAGRLVYVLDGWSMQQSELFAVYPSTRNLSPKVRAFLEFLTSKLTPAPWSR